MCAQAPAADGHAAAEQPAGAVVADALPHAGRVRVAHGVPRVVRARGRHRRGLAPLQRRARAPPARGTRPLLSLPFSVEGMCMAANALL